MQLDPSIVVAIVGGIFSLAGIYLAHFLSVKQSGSSSEKKTVNPEVSVEMETSTESSRGKSVRKRDHSWFLYIVFGVALILVSLYLGYRENITSYMGLFLLLIGLYRVVFK